MSQTAASTTTSGFVQSSNDLTGLTNTDRATRRGKKRRMPLLDTSWVTRDGKGTRVMTKYFETELGLLQKSLEGILASEADNRLELMSESLRVFGEDLDASHAGELAKAAPVAPLPVLAKGLNHISRFAQAVSDASNTADRLKGIPGGYGYVSDSYSNEPKPDPEICDMLDDWVNHGILVLQRMVNDKVELPTEHELMQAEKTSGLVKMLDGGWIKTELPPQYAHMAAPPTEIAYDLAKLADTLAEDAINTYEGWVGATGEHDPNLIRDFPHLFKAAGDPDDGTPDAAGNDPASTGDPGGEPADDIGNMPPLEVCLRLLAATMTVLGSLQQSMGDPADDDAGAGAGDPSGAPDDTGGMAMAAPSGDLSKRLQGILANRLGESGATGAGATGAGAGGDGATRTPPATRTPETGLTKADLDASMVELGRMFGQHLAKLDEKVDTISRQPMPSAIFRTDPTASESGMHPPPAAGFSPDEMRKRAEQGDEASGEMVAARMIRGDLRAREGV